MTAAGNDTRWLMSESDQAHTHGGFSGMHSHDGGPLHWHDEFGEHYSEDLTEAEIAARKLDWKKHHLVLVTVGADIGSSTSHLMFSRIFMQLLGEAPAVHSVVVGREILWQSPIILTPYREDGSIDADALQRFIAGAYQEVGATVSDVDTGAVILTGEALKRQNARDIAELFAVETGKFVCATAGHHLEAVLAANGSGTVMRSRRDGSTLLNVDIGGGTTKLALVRDGEIVATAAVAIGARQVVRDTDGHLTRIDEPVRRTAAHLGIELKLGEKLAPQDEAKIVQTWVDCIAGLIAGRPMDSLTESLMLTGPLPGDTIPQALTFSGGVSEFIFFRESGDFGDLGRALARAVRDALSNGAITLPAIIDPNLGIRATAVGASMFSSHVGINVYVSDETALPLRNVPVLAPRLDLDAALEPADVAAAIQAALARADLEEGAQPIALAFHSPEEDEAGPALMAALTRGIREGLPRTIEHAVPLVLLSDQAVARAVGEAMTQVEGIHGPVIALERVSVAEFDFIDLAEVIHPTEAIPLTVKSLLFAGGLDKRSIRQALLDASRAVS